MRISLRDIFVFVILPFMCLSLIPAMYSLTAQKKSEDAAKNYLVRLFHDYDEVSSLSFEKDRQSVLEKQKTTKPKITQSYSTWLKSSAPKRPAIQLVSSPVQNNLKPKSSENLNIKPRINHSLFQGK